MDVVKKDVLPPKPEQTVVPAHHGPMLGSPDGNKCYLESSQPVEAATVYTANLGLTQFYGTTTSTDACTTPVSFPADARLDRRSHAKTTTDAATIPAHHKLGFYGNKRIEREYGESAT